MQQQFISEKCSWFCADIDFSNITQQTTYLQLSGLGMNRLGLYRQCLEIGNSYYLVEAKLSSKPSNFFVGLCLNSNCTTSDTRYILNSVNQFVNNTYEVIDVKEPAEFEQGIGIIQIIVLSVCLLFILFRIAMTFRKNYNNNEPVRNNAKFNSILSEFSLQASIQGLFERRNNNQRIRVFSGLRVLSLLGIVISNTCIMITRTPTEPLQKINSSIFFLIYTLSTDVWLFLSGFYFSYELLKVYYKHKTLKILIKGFMRKFMRMWPISIIILILVFYILPLTGSGACWQYLTSYLNKQCTQSIIPYIFMVSNYLNSNCDFWLWLWHIQLQLSFIFCILLIAKFSNVHNGIIYGIQGILVAGSFLSIYFWEEDGDLNKLEEIDKGVWKWSITRCIPYIIGFNLGNILFEFRIKKQKQKHILIKIYKYRISRIISPLIGFTIILLSYLFYESLRSLSFRKMILNLMSLLDILGLVLIVLSPLIGYSSPIGLFLSDWLFRALSKITFSAIAVQYIVISWICYNRNHDLYLTNIVILQIGACCFAVTLVASFLFSCILQVPYYRSIVKYLRWDNSKYNQF